MSTRSTSSRRARIDLIVNTPRGRGPRADGMHIRRAAVTHGVACVTTVAAAVAAAAGIAEAVSREPEVRSLQELPPRRAAPVGGVSAGPPPRDRRPEVTGDVDLSVALGPLVLPNPVVAASGTFGHGDELARALRSGANSAR